MSVVATLELDGYDEQTRRQRAALLANTEGVIASGIENNLVTDIIVDPSSSSTAGCPVFFDYLSGQRERQVGRDMRPGTVRAIINRIAGMQGKKLENGLLEAEVPFDGSRIQAWLPPLVPGPAMVIRKHRKQGQDGWPALRLSDYDMPTSLRELLAHIVEERKTLLIVGSTGSGKTAFGGAFLDAVVNRYKEDRFVTIEGVFELYCNAESWLALHSTPTVSERQLLRSALRGLPTWIIVGEGRDEAVIDLVEGLTTGHPGFTTTHSGTPEGGLMRILQLSRGALTPEMVCAAFDYVVQMRRRPPPDGRRYIESISQTVGFSAGRFQTKPAV